MLNLPDSKFPRLSCWQTRYPTGYEGIPSANIMALKNALSQSSTTSIPRKYDTASSVSAVFKELRLVNKHEAAAILGISPETLKKYRLQDGSPFIEGVHYHVWNSRTIRYNPELLADWGLNRTRPEQHQRTIEAYLAAIATDTKSKRRASRLLKQGS
jgi:hypothetical protein